MTVPPETARTQVIEEIAKLARTHGIGIEEIRASIQETNSGAEKNGITLNRLFSYLGGTFIFSGIGLLVSFIWDDIGSAQRIIITLGAGIVALALGIFAARDARHEKAATPLFLIAALLQPSGMFVFLDEYVPPSGDVTLAAIAIFSIMAVQQTLAFLVLRRTTLLFFACLFFYGALAPWMGRLEIDDEIAGIAIGASMLCLCTWIAKGPHRILAPFGNFFGTVFLLAGVYRFFEDFPIPVFPAIDAFVIYLSLTLRSRTILFASVAGLLAYLTDYAWEHFAHVIGWPVLLILLGFSFLGIGGLVVRLSGKMANSNA